MHIVKTLIKSFLLPPGPFIVLMIGYGCWGLARRHILRGLPWLFLGMAAWGLATVPVADALLKPLEKGLRIPADPAGDVVIVLGAGTNVERPDPLGKGGPSQRTLARLVAGARLHRQLGLPVLVSGRGSSNDPQAAAGIVARYLTDLGVPANRIIVESQSRDTAENAAFSAEICRARGFKQPILITAASHLKRAAGRFKAEGLDVLPYPSSFETWENRRYTWTTWLPTGFDRSALALHEYLALLSYRILSTSR